MTYMVSSQVRAYHHNYTFVCSKLVWTFVASTDIYIPVYVPSMTTIVVVEIILALMLVYDEYY